MPTQDKIATVQHDLIHEILIYIFLMDTILERFFFAANMLKET